MRDDLIAYKGAWLYSVWDGTWEGNLRGFHYSADTLDELKDKIDKAVETDDPGQTMKLYSAEPKHFKVVNEDDKEDYDYEDEWAVQYQFEPSDEYDDERDGSDIREVIIAAPDFDTARKYAEQYARKAAHEETGWDRAEIISITKR